MSPTDRQLGMLRLFKRICLFAGVPLLVVGIVLVGRTALFLKGAQRTVARVTKVDSSHVSSNGRRTKVFQPTFEFVDGSGTSRTVTLNHSSSGYDYGVGRRVAILYRPENPNRLRVASFFGVWGVALIVSGLGLVACTFGLLTSLAGKNLLKRHEENVRRAGTARGPNPS